MKILVIGKGVIGTITAEALVKADNEVYHYIRNPEKATNFEQGVTLKLVDGRKNAAEKEHTSLYKPQIVYDLQTGFYDYVIISVNAHQLEQALTQIVPKVNCDTILICSNRWQDQQAIEAICNDKPYVYFFPNAGGGYTESAKGLILSGAIGDSMTIGTLNGSSDRFVAKAEGLFKAAGFQIVHEKNMLHWLWSHYAFITGLNAACVAAGGNAELLGSIGNIRKAVLYIKEALNVCAARGVDLKQFAQPKLFLMPTPIITLGFWLTLKTDKVSAAIILDYKGVEEIKVMYRELCKTAQKTNTNISKLALLERVM